MTQPLVIHRGPPPLRAPRTDWLRDALREVLCAAEVSPERLRAVVVRFAATAREWAAAVDDVVLTVHREARPYLERLPTALRAELAASIQWWTVHGFHRAD